jgi:hypothetical protein
MASRPPCQARRMEVHGPELRPSEHIPVRCALSRLCHRARLHPSDPRRYLARSHDGVPSSRWQQTPRTPAKCQDATKGHRPGPSRLSHCATAAGHVVHRFPYREWRLPGRTEEGLWDIEPYWLPQPPPEPDGELEPAIAGLLTYCWKPLDLDHPDPLDVTADWLRSEGYTVKFVVPR